MNRLKIRPLLLLIISLAFALLVGGPMPYFIFYILLLTMLLPLVHVLINLWGLKGAVVIPSESLFSGENINIEYHIKNNSILPITYLEIQSNISKELTGIDYPAISISLKKNQSYSNRETIVLKRRGYFEAGEVNVIIKDVFGLYSFTKTISSNTSLLVYPQIVSLSTFNITASQQLGELLIQDSTFQDISRINTIREYKEGDSVKSIHWKLSAKKDNPIIKEFENRGDTHGLIIIDNYSELFKKDVNHRLEDKAVDVALSIVNYYLSQNVSVSLETQNHQKLVRIDGHQNSDLKPFLETLAKFKANGILDFNSILTPRVETYRKGTTIVIITPNLDKSMGAQGIYLKMKNLNPVFVVLTDIVNRTGYIDQVIEERLKQEGILIYNLDYKTSINDTLGVYYV